jgi:hypothetical protein
MNVVLSDGREANARTVPVSLERARELKVLIVSRIPDACPTDPIPAGDLFQVYYRKPTPPPQDRKLAAPDQVWMVRVSGGPVPVQLTAVYTKLSGSRTSRCFRGINTKTGRQIEGHILRLRFRTK